MLSSYLEVLIRGSVIIFYISLELCLNINLIQHIKPSKANVNVIKVPVTVLEIFFTLSAQEVYLDQNS